MNIQELRKRRQALKEKTDTALNNMQIIAEESLRVAKVAHNSKEILDNLDAEFERQTGLDKTDVKFLFFATALQIGRWVVINKINQLVTEKMNGLRMKDNDSSIQKMEREARDAFKDTHDGIWDHNKSEKYPTWLEIVYDGVPYDVSIGSPNFGVNMEGGYHRIHTLGHDPLLGWLFGTMNIISSTITLNDFRTYKVFSRPKPKHWQYQTNLIEAFRMAIESIKEDENRLPAAIFAQAIHLKSDAFTKYGLPVPILETFVPDFAGRLYKSNYDSLCLLKDITIIGAQAGWAILINMIISLIHGLYYIDVKCSSRDVYEAKTRKILFYSDLISTASNVVWIGVNANAGNERAWKDLDIGGIIVTMHRLVTDTNFIRSVKEEFVFGGFKNMIRGKDLSL